jgi:hypothetical protein
VTWYHDLSTKDWATWLPGDAIKAGSVGSFNAERCFEHRETLEGHGISIAQYSGDIPLDPIFCWTAGGFEFEPAAASKVAPGFGLLGEVGGRLKFTAKTEHACLLQMLNPTEKRIKNQQQVKEAVLARLISGDWNIDDHIVMRRTRCTSGFALISKARGKGVELTTTADLPAVIGDQDLPGLDLRLAPGWSNADFLLRHFGQNSTPTFGDVSRVKRDLWDKLLPWSHREASLIDPNGKRFLPRQLPPGLTGYAAPDRRYDPARSAMSLAELSRLTVDDVFEEVTTPLGEADSGPEAERGQGSGPVELAEVRHFPVPRSAVPATLAAADEEDARILLDSVLEDGLLHFTLYDRGYGRYWLEATLRRPASEPSVVTLRYRTADGASRDLIIPVGGDGRAGASSIVSLPDYQPGTEGEAWLTAARDARVFPPDVVRTSVLAVVGQGTARAWERLASLVSAETGDVINRELRALRGAE